MLVEGSFAADLITESLEIYHFPIREDSDPFMIGPTASQPDIQEDEMTFEQEEVKMPIKDGKTQSDLKYKHY